MPAGKDPKSYVRPVPLPIPACTGLKLLARDTINFNPEVPSREDVRKNNYNRRLNQMSAMGFKSVSYKPYMGIGDPFYLDEKKMILHALGQWTEEEEETSSSGEETDEEDNDRDVSPKHAFTAAKFVLRRSRKDLNTLNKAVTHGRNMIRNVSLGHGLFDLINKEKQSKEAASEAALRKRQEQLRNEFQPPKTESDDETDEDLENDVDLTKIARAEDEKEYRRAKSAMLASELTASYSRPVSRKKKKEETPRPYTPQHLNLSSNLEAVLDTEEADIMKDALFRQLCVLHWILEAMSTDPPSAMTPIMSCWSLTDIGGSRAQPRKLQKEKSTEAHWQSFLSKDTPKVSKRLSNQRSSRSPHIRRPVYTPGKNSGQSSAAGSQQGSTTGLNTMATQMSLLSVRNRQLQDEEPMTTKQEEEDEQINKSIFKFLDEYYESLKYEEEKKGKQETSKSPSSTPPGSPTPDKQNKMIDEKKKKKKKVDRSGSPKEKRLDHKVAVALGEEEKLSSKYLRANSHLIRAKSEEKLKFSPALVEFQNLLPSNKKVTLTADLHNQFAECREEKALTLHDILDHKEGQRMTVCKTKFLSFQGMKHGSSFHRAVEQMRVQSWQQLRKPPSEKNKPDIKRNWYTDLVGTIPMDLQSQWYYAKILQKLQNFGLVEGTGKQSIYKFIKVLEGLREWEICSPDISAAIEFCRERIVEMTIEEYESWFTQRFPKITRPQTAPPAPKVEKKAESKVGSATPIRRGVIKRATQSAFTRRVQR